MTHDPLCPVSKWPAEYPQCQCGLIADVIAAAVHRVEAIPAPNRMIDVMPHGEQFVRRSAAIAAIKGES
jgi:hypothetical protein